MIPAWIGPTGDLHDPLAADAGDGLMRMRLPRDRLPAVEVLAQRMQAARPVVVQHEPARVRMSARLDAEHVLHLALVPVRRRNDARDRREYGLRGIDLRLDRDELACRESERVIQPVSATALALVGAGHHHEPGMVLTHERGAHLGELLS